MRRGAGMEEGSDPMRGHCTAAFFCRKRLSSVTILSQHTLIPRVCSAWLLGGFKVD